MSGRGKKDKKGKKGTEGASGQAPRWALWIATGLLTAAVLGWYALDRRDMQPAAFAPAQSAPRQQQAALNVNTATADELEDLPGIGPALAERILAWRAGNGPFSGPEDLQQVSGVGPALCQAIEPFIRYE